LSCSLGGYNSFSRDHKSCEDWNDSVCRGVAGVCEANWAEPVWCDVEGYSDPLEDELLLLREDSNPLEV
jgi:hypothetical protein